MERFEILTGNLTGQLKGFFLLNLSKSFFFSKSFFEICSFVEAMLKCCIYETNFLVKANFSSQKNKGIYFIVQNYLK